MRLSMRNLRARIPRWRLWAALTGAALAAASVAAAVPGAASAQTFTGIYLAHEQSYGMFAENGVNPGSVIALKTPPWGTWDAIPMGTTSEHGVTGPGYEFESITTSGADSGLCMQTLSEGGLAQLGPCGANGTVFIEVSNGGGYLMYSRYFLNMGKQVALATYGFDPYGDFDVFALPASQLTTGIYYRWAFSPPL
jgi:hypothetical protein